MARKKARALYERTVLITMKVFCRYSVVDVNSGESLACGEKWKLSDNIESTYIKDFSFGVFRKLTVYHRNLDICGRRCVILLFAHKNKRRGTSYNCLTCFGYQMGLSGHYVTADNKSWNYNDILDFIGIARVT